MQPSACRYVGEDSPAPLPPKNGRAEGTNHSTTSTSSASNSPSMSNETIDRSSPGPTDAFTRDTSVRLARTNVPSRVYRMSCVVS